MSDSWGVHLSDMELKKKIEAVKPPDIGFADFVELLLHQAVRADAPKAS